MAEAPGRPAVFLDRDGTLVEDPTEVPGPVHLIAGAGPAVARLNAHGLPVIVATNQAGIARGQISWEQYTRTAEDVDRLLAVEHARLDGTYVCPHAPEVSGPCPCRKPGTELYQRAARDHGLRFEASWWVGDRLTDLMPSRVLGGRGILVLTGQGRAHEAASRGEGFPVVGTLGDAVERILAG